MRETDYPQAGQALLPYQSNLAARLHQAAQLCTGLELLTLEEFNHLAQSVTQAFFDFLQQPQGHAPYHLGEMLNQARASSMFLSLLNRTMRDFCFDHLPDELLATGLEATADFFLFVIQAYIQANQGLMLMTSLNRQQQEQCRRQFTPNELSTLKYLAQGKNNRQIARAIGITERSVANYLRQIRQKLGTTGRIETVLAAIPLITDNDGYNFRT
jgi:DNA-binding CsgD family transcriptional regulator